MTKELLNPLIYQLRAIKYQFLKAQASSKVKNLKIGDQKDSFSPPVFIIGCGRSGTTILGSVLSLHPDIKYLFEPYHLWAAVDPITDTINFYHEIEARYLMNESFGNEETKARFNRLFIQENKSRKILIEKTPINTARIGYLKTLAPGAKFIHIVRDGVDVSRSIARLATTNSYKIAGKPKLNQWWGIDDCKWQALSHDGAAAGYYPYEVAQLKEHEAKGAYEWLVSLGEVDRWRERLGDRLLEFTYDRLTIHPEKILQDICHFLNLDRSKFWLKKAERQIISPDPSQPKTIILPPTMCEAFNQYQEHYGFVNRAIVGEYEHNFYVK